MTAIGLQWGLIVWLAAVVGVALAIVVLRFNIQKWVIEFATAFLGAGAIVGVFVILFGGSAAQVFQNPVQFALKNSPFWLIVFLVPGIAGFVLQALHNRSWDAQTYNRMSDTMASA